MYVNSDCLSWEDPVIRPRGLNTTHWFLYLIGPHPRTSGVKYEWGKKLPGGGCGQSWSPSSHYRVWHAADGQCTVTEWYDEKKTVKNNLLNLSKRTLPVQSFLRHLMRVPANQQALAKRKQILSTSKQIMSGLLMITGFTEESNCHKKQG